MTTTQHLTALDSGECRRVVQDDAAAESLRQAAARNLEYLSRLPINKEMTAFDRTISAASLTSMMNAISSWPGDDWSGLCDRYHLYKVTAPDLLITGYYQPELSASRRRTSRFRYPLYRVPDDLVDIDISQFCPACERKVVQGRVKDGKLVPYYTRGEIEAGSLSGRDLEIAWLDDPVEVYFLHVQGSALLRLEDGVLLEVSYSGTNGQPYTSIGRILIDRGKVSSEAMTLKTLKDYLRAYPEEQASLLSANQRYIFFRGVVVGPIGSLGVPLTGGRSLADDPSIYPPGALAFVHIAPRPQGAASVRRDYRRLAIVQDAGSAISGANRLDVFWGTGSGAEEIAGDMRNPGELYLMLPY
ncbi:MAG: MltA domain-containing protein [Deltaproteobacteria bacterium]|nr:MltA domain-containing protein [Deltaproteobacteria bacterium]